jgi:hypothetical protein
VWWWWWGGGYPPPGVEGEVAYHHHPYVTHRTTFKIIVGAKRTLRERFSREKSFSHSPSNRTNLFKNEAERLIILSPSSRQIKDCWMNCSQENLDAEYRTRTESGSRECEKNFVDPFPQMARPNRKHCKPICSKPAENLLKTGFLREKPAENLLKTGFLRAEPAENLLKTC